MEARKLIQQQLSAVNGTILEVDENDDADDAETFSRSLGESNTESGSTFHSEEKESLE